MKATFLTLCLFCAATTMFAQNWVMQNVGFHLQGSNAFQISIVDGDCVWATGAVGVVASFDNEFTRTTDGGIHWHRGTVPLDSSYSIVSVSAVDTAQAYIVAGNLGSAGSLVYRTIDGGNTWQQVDSGGTFTGASSYGIQVHFWDALHGIMAGDPNGSLFEIYSTTDGGISWIPVSLFHMPAAIPGEYALPKSFAYGSTACWFGTSEGRVFRSTDYGQNWTVSYTGITGMALPCFTDTSSGLSSVWNGTGVYYLRTIDGGITWTTLQPTGPAYALLTAIPGTNIFISYEGDPVNPYTHGSSYSVDGGQSWISIDTLGAGTTNGYGWIAFKDIQTGWAGGISQDSLTGGIYKWNPGILGTHALNAMNFVYSLQVNPNPVTQESATISFTLPHASQVQLTLFDLAGKRLVSESVASSEGQNTATFDIGRLSQGMYLLMLDDGKHTVSTRVVSKAEQ